jgi:hypothetical protein
MKKINHVNDSNAQQRTASTFNAAKAVLPPTIPRPYDPTKPPPHSMVYAPVAPPPRIDSITQHSVPRTETETFIRRSVASDVEKSFQVDDMILSPGRESLGHESNTSHVTNSSSTASASSSSSFSSNGCRGNSAASTDSGRDSLRRCQLATNTFGVPVASYRAKFAPDFARSGTPPRRSYHSSTSSIGSFEARGDLDSICTLDVQEMIANAIPDLEVLLAWLTDLTFEEYFDLFASAGYDMPTVSRMTPEDLTAIGVQKPNHRKKIMAEIAKLAINDGLPNYIPASVGEWLLAVRLSEYGHMLWTQGYASLEEVAQISVEDLEDVGIFKLGHQKRFLLGIRRIKDLRSGRFGRNQSPLKCKQSEPRNSFRSLNCSMSSLAAVQCGPQIRDYTQASSMSTNKDHVQVKNPTYQPDVIRIARSPCHVSIAPSLLVMPAPIHLPSHELSTATTGGLLGMPQPMRPLSGFARYTSSFSTPSAGALCDAFGAHANAGPHKIRSMDDSFIESGSRAQQIKSTPFGSLSLQTSSGGTLPRPKGFGKPIPVAKITGSSRDKRLEDVVMPREGQNSPSFMSVSALQEANTLVVKNLKIESNPEIRSTCCPSAPGQGGNRNAGDVLNDIGSMLADLTEELDSMLKVDHHYPQCQ